MSELDISYVPYPGYRWTIGVTTDWVKRPPEPYTWVVYQPTDSPDEWRRIRGFADTYEDARRAITEAWYESRLAG